MLHGVEFLCSVVAALARLVAHVLVGKAALIMPRCSPRTSAVQVQVGALAPPPWAARKAHPPQPAPEARESHQLLPPPPAAAAPAAAKPARGRPSRLIIPPPAVARAGADPFGGAGGRETDVAATEVEARGEGFCVASRRGVRHAMEDGYGVITDAAGGGGGGGSRLAFYGVYDGHGGRAAVDFIVDRLGKNILAALANTPTSTAAAESRRQPAGSSSSSSSSSQQGKDDQLHVMAAIRAGYLTTDSEFLTKGARGGACAATALVKDNELYVANVGDCRAVLGSRGGAAIALTADHTPGRHDERSRIEASGGYVSCGGGGGGGGGVWRVQGCLAVSRAFGDADMKPWVTCEPEISRHRLTGDCRFLVLASDGLWSKVSNQEAVDVVFSRSGGGGGGGVSMESCKELVAMARSRGSRDDITVMAVDLRPFLR